MIIDQQLKSNYESATYRIIKPLIDLKIGQCNQQLDELLLDNHVVNWAIITAYNANSQITDSKLNSTRQLELEKWLESEHWLWIQGCNVDPKAIWPDEPSCFVLGIEVKQALTIAREFGQKAIVYGYLGSAAKLGWTGL